MHSTSSKKKHSFNSHHVGAHHHNVAENNNNKKEAAALTKGGDPTATDAPRHDHHCSLQQDEDPAGQIKRLKTKVQSTMQLPYEMTTQERQAVLQEQNREMLQGGLKVAI